MVLPTTATQQRTNARERNCIKPTQHPPTSCPNAYTPPPLSLRATTYGEKKKKCIPASLLSRQHCADERKNFVEKRFVNVHRRTATNTAKFTLRTPCPIFFPPQPHRQYTHIPPPPPPPFFHYTSSKRHNALRKTLPTLSAFCSLLGSYLKGVF